MHRIFGYSPYGINDKQQLFTHHTMQKAHFAFDKLTCDEFTEPVGKRTIDVRQNIIILTCMGYTVKQNCTKADDNDNLKGM